MCGVYGYDYYYGFDLMGYAYCGVTLIGLRCCIWVLVYSLVGSLLSAKYLVITWLLLLLLV